MNKRDEKRSDVCLLRLYIAGDSPQSRAAVKSLRALGKRRLGSLCRLEVIDITVHPDAAARDNVWAVPTLVKVLPGPRREIVGDLSDPDGILKALDFSRTA